MTGTLAKPNVPAGPIRQNSQPVRERQASGNGLPKATQSPPERERPATPTLEIANAVVHTYKELLGRGPTKARALFAGDDVLLVVLEDTMTVQERNLASVGEERRLLDQRLFLISTAEDQFRSIIEAVVGRRTVARVSGFDIHRDVAVETFTLEPEPADGQSATT
jgi:uncharacterized protein YbcI